MRKNLFWILTAILEILIIIASILRHSSNENYVLDIYSVIVFFLLEAYITAGFFLKEMISHRKKMIVVMFANAVIVSDIWASYNWLNSYDALMPTISILLFLVLSYFVLTLLLK